MEGILRDITEKYREEYQSGFSSQEENSCYSNSLQGLQTKDGILILGSTGEIIDANETACDLLGFDKKEILGVSIETFFIEALFLLNADWDKTKANSISFEKFLFKNPRQIINAEINIYALDNKKTIVIIRDNTERKKASEQNHKIIEELKFNQDLLENQSAELVRLSQQLSESEERLKELIIEKDKFFSIMAHDIKSPFAGLLGLSSLLYEECYNMEKDKIKEYLFHFDNLIKNQYRLIENLLEWSRLQSGKMKCEPAKMNAVDSVIYIMNLISQNAVNKSVSILNNVTENIFIHADQRMFNSILENVLANAIKFTPSNGTIEINSFIENDYLIMSIKDSGIGMTDELMKNVFRIDVSHSTLGTEKEKGTGLGLILCKEMIEKLKGFISIKSEAGKGTEVSIRLPLWKPSGEAQELDIALNIAE